MYTLADRFGNCVCYYSPCTVVVFSSELVLLRRFDIAVLTTVYSPLSLYIISDVKSSCCMGAERSVNKSTSQQNYSDFTRTNIKHLLNTTKKRKFPRVNISVV